MMELSKKFNQNTPSIKPKAVPKGVKWQKDTGAVVVAEEEEEEEQEEVEEEGEEGLTRSKDAA